VPRGNQLGHETGEALRGALTATVLRVTGSAGALVVGPGAGL